MSLATCFKPEARAYRKLQRVRDIVAAFYTRHPDQKVLTGGKVSKPRGAKGGSLAQLARDLAKPDRAADPAHRGRLTELVAEFGGVPPSERKLQRMLQTPK